MANHIFFGDKVYLPEGISFEERTKKLNDRVRNLKPGVCIERARIVTESFKSTEGEPRIVRIAKSFRDVLRKMTIFILDDELIVGNISSHQRWAPLFPEGGHFDEKELLFFPSRDIDTLQIDKESIKELLEVIYPYWNNNCLEDVVFHYIPDETARILRAKHNIFDPMSRTRSGYGHFIPKIQKILSIGFKGIEDDIMSKISNLDSYDPLLSQKMQFYRSAIEIIKGIKEFANRYSSLAKELSINENNPRRKKELEIISKVCNRVPYYPAKNFHQALQSYWFTLMLCYLSQNGSAVSAGRFDQYMFPYYKADINMGKIAKKEALELLGALWVKYSEIIKASAYSSAKNNAGFNTNIHLTLGGVDSNGHDAINELSYLCLKVEKFVYNNEPNTGIRINTKTSNEFILKCIDVIADNQGGKLPFFNDNAIITGLITDGVSLKLARDYGIVGCVEPTPSGNTLGNTNFCYSNLAKALELALNGGKCRLCGEQIGPKTKDPNTFKSFEEVKEAFEKQVEAYVSHMIITANAVETVIGLYYPHPYISLLIDGCVEKGLDATWGGSIFNYTGPQGVGVPDVADSLAAIKKCIFEEKKFEIYELTKALDMNFKGMEEMRQILINKAPKYGNDIDEVDEIAAWVAEVYCREVRKGRNIRGGHFRPGLYAVSSNVPLGQNVGALPSGRLAKTPLADGGLSPKHGMDVNGPSAAMCSVAKIDHANAINGTLLNQKYDPSLLESRLGREKLLSLIRGYFDMGAFHVQFNIIDNKTLRAAKKDPEKYRDLVVRVAGYSAFFVELNEEVQDDIIKRTTYHGNI